jgi:hypothetical protein
MINEIKILKEKFDNNQKLLKKHEKNIVDNQEFKQQYKKIKE